jgi:hypothetical protein
MGPVLHAPSKFHSASESLRVFVPSLTGMVGLWATVALNIPDFTRFAKSQRAQMLGLALLALGLPTAMTLYSLIGVAVTSASVVLFGEAIWDPVALLGRFNQPLIALIALVALLLATLNTNVAANVISPSNDFSNLRPSLISFRTGGLSSFPERAGFLHLCAAGLESLCTACGTIGNAGFDSFTEPRGPWSDFSLAKNFGITGCFIAQFRFDAYNVFNHPVLGLNSMRATPASTARRCRPDYRHRAGQLARFADGHAPTVLTPNTPKRGNPTRVPPFLFYGVRWLATAFDAAK